MTTHPTLPNLRDAIVDRKIIRDTFKEDVLAGLARPQKAIPAKHLYDAHGSEVFDQICDVSEYYPTRTERTILDSNAQPIARAIGRAPTLIEPGAGTGQKAESLLATLEEPVAYVPIEISESALEAGAHRVAERFPEVKVHPYCADFTADLEYEPPVERAVVFFPGSTIGNFTQPERGDLLKSFAQLAGDAGTLLVGYDLVKQPDVLRDAYNDSAGVTAEFNLNLLRRMNSELAADFNLDRFEHDAVWNEVESRIEMHLVSKEEQRVRVADHTFDFAAGEYIHTENSHKFTPEGFDAEASQAGFSLIKHWTDANDWFCVGLYRADDV